MNARKEEGNEKKVIKTYMTNQETLRNDKEEQICEMKSTLFFSFS